MADGIWYLAICVECNGGLFDLAEHPEETLPMPFDEQDMRTSWVNAHMEGTRHSILLLDQYDPATTTTKDDLNDATT